MIERFIDSVVSAVSPVAGLRRQAARKALARSYQGAEPSRVSSNKYPRNLPADQELMGPYGADKLRAWARLLVRDNAYAWGVVDTIVSSVVGAGIQAQSTFETPEGDDIEDVNDLRDKAWAEWSEVADINGRLTLEEIQIIALREMVEGGEVLIRIVNLPSTEYRGITRPIPMALEIIEADRLATDRDTYMMGIDRGDGTRVVRGIKVDESGKPLAYMIYDDHPLQPYAVSRTPKEIPAREIIHLFRQDRVGQTRGVTWFAPALASIRDLGTYLENELQASAIASCFTAAIKTETPMGNLSDPDTGSGIDRAGNRERYIEPGLIFDLNPGESVEVINPTRPNNAAGEWTKVILRGIAVGTGLSYEVVARDYSQTSYSSSRASQLEDRRRFRVIQKYIIRHLLQPVWDRFCDAATRSNLNGFPLAVDLLSDRRRFTPVEWQTPKWEWVDPGVEQQTSESGINSFTATYSEVLGAQGLNFRTVFYQRAKENRLLAKLGLQTPEQTQLAISAAQTQGVAKTQPVARQVHRNCGIGAEGFKSGNSCAGGGGVGEGGSYSSDDFNGIKTEGARLKPEPPTKEEIESAAKSSLANQASSRKERSVPVSIVENGKAKKASLAPVGGLSVTAKTAEFFEDQDGGVYVKDILKSTFSKIIVRPATEAEKIKAGDFAKGQAREFSEFVLTNNRKFDSKALDLSKQLKSEGHEVKIVVPEDATSRYVYVKPKGGGKEIKIRFADHAQPVANYGKGVEAVGGYSKEKKERHSAADISIDPKTKLTIEDALKIVEYSSKAGASA
jgi:lambda family phage portal protein